MSKKSGNGSWWVLGVLALVVGFVSQQGSLPVPRKFTGGSFVERLDARVTFYWQTFQHISGWRDEYDVELLQEKYLKLIPNATKNTFKNKLPKLEQLPEIDATKPNWKKKFDQYFRNTWNPATPVVVRKLSHVDSVNHPGMKDWNLEYLRDNIYKGKSIPVFTNCTNDKSVIFEPFEEFVNHMNDKNLVRYARCVSDVDGKLGKGINTPHVAELSGKSTEHKISMAIEGGDTPCMFIGGTHVNSRVHSDFSASVFFQIQGSKRWVFFPPSEAMLMYPIAHRYNVAYNADLDIFNPDLEKHYLHGALEGYEVVINPGDVLFFPSFWWHGVQNKDDVTIGMDFAVVDFLGSWMRNSLLHAGTLLNANSLGEVIKSCFVKTEGGIRDIFFDGYRMDKE